MTGHARPDFRPGDGAGWRRLGAHLKDYERARTGAHGAGHVVRPPDVAALEALLVRRA